MMGGDENRVRRGQPIDPPCMRERGDLQDAARHARRPAIFAGVDVCEVIGKTGHPLAWQAGGTGRVQALLANRLA